MIHRRNRLRRGSSAIELVMTTAVIFPLSIVAFYLGVKMLQFVFAVDSALLLSPI
jgi:hypothetical protein